MLIDYPVSMAAVVVVAAKARTRVNPRCSWLKRLRHPVFGSSNLPSTHDAPSVIFLIIVIFITTSSAMRRLSYFCLLPQILRLG
ncbi:hypothetical protein SODALDRAFT_357543 [Sodiomyces alkalinus F11]|uniref:Uncharacterized protein n=1 Tax=Sodiomyces alkalinus (strain CBS 110278 / VKM F-3762 / F11) TaxID=1314773 RepID=A0A3N2Q409_SODAK|nr:hypothetical protein SODALDRAFT_357543 [Sodiomyces alkalinus F11]ROT41490.1 hypothetical protein SODALDRAFT_357543 [Sodiomyces alkalinus F11]